MKTHKNLCHKSAEQLISLFQMAGKLNARLKKIIKEVVENCSICQKFKKTPARPKVALPKASSVNKIVSVDLKELRN